MLPMFFFFFGEFCFFFFFEKLPTNLAIYGQETSLLIFLAFVLKKVNILSVELGTTGREKEGEI